jgi:hypothetical protein
VRNKNKRKGSPRPYFWGGRGLKNVEVRLKILRIQKPDIIKLSIALAWHACMHGCGHGQAGTKGHACHTQPREGTGVLSAYQLVFFQGTVDRGYCARLVSVRERSGVRVSKGKKNHPHWRPEQTRDGDGRDG